MITWMQRHKKYLVVTIWISVIGFVGAGFAGWGSVDFNFNRGNNVAKVGNLYISNKEFNSQYAQIFALHNQLSNGTLTNEDAINLGLNKQALYELIRSKLLLNYALDLGFRVSEEEVLAKIANTQEFYIDGKFDKNRYVSLLKQIGLSPKDYEESVKNDILLSKLFFTIQNKTINNINPFTSEYIVDNVKLKSIKLNEKINITEQQMQDYWQEHRHDYLSEKSYDISIFSIAASKKYDDDSLKEFWQENKQNYTNDDGSLKEFKDIKEQLNTDLALKNLELDAKKIYVDLKNNKKDFQYKSNIKEDDDSEGFLEYVSQLKVNEIVFPFLKDNKYYILRLDAINEPKELSFNEAKSEVQSDLLNQIKEQKLEDLAKNALNSDIKNPDFSGEISLGSDNKTKFSDSEYLAIVNDIYSKDVKKSYIVFEDKAVVYEIVSQKLLDESKLQASKSSLENIVFKKEFSALINELLSQLSKKYQTIEYVKVD